MTPPDTGGRSATRCPPRLRSLHKHLGLAVSNSPTTPPRPSVRHRAHRGWQRGEASRELRVSSRRYTHFPCPQLHLLISSDLPASFFFQTSPKLHFPFKEISEGQLTSACGPGSHGPLSACVLHGPLYTDPGCRPSSCSGIGWTQCPKSIRLEARVHFRAAPWAHPTQREMALPFPLRRSASVALTGPAECLDPGCWTGVFLKGRAPNPVPSGVRQVKGMRPARCQ